MRNTFFLLSLISFFPTVSMEAPAEEKTWTWEIFHIIDQWTDPLSYFTDTRAPKVCDEVMRFGLDPEKKEDEDKYRKYTGDAQCLDDIKSALKRQRALLTSLEIECLKDTDSKVELLRDASERQPGYFSQNVLALIESYLKRAGKNARDHAHILGKQVGKTLDPVPVPEHLTSVDVIEETRAVTYQTIVNLVMGTSWYAKENMVNYLRKTWTDPLKYLIDEKAQNISLAMRHFHPRHKFHTEQWLFTNKLELHRKLIHQALEREMRLTVAIQYAIEKDKSWMVVNLNPENPDNKFVMENIGSSYSPIARAAIKGFLKYKEKKQTENVDEKEQKEQSKKELTEKNQEVSKLLNSLGRKLSSATNKEKLQPLAEEQRSSYNAIKNSLAGNHTATSQEILDAHTKLTELSKVVDHLLSTSVQKVSSPSLTTSATSLPSFAAAVTELKPMAKTPPSQPSPIQMVVQTAHLAVSPALPATIQQTQLPEPILTVAPVPATPEPQVAPQIVKQESASNILAPKSHSPIASISDASATIAKPESPQASPPITPDGSLLVTPSNALEKSYDEDFPDPRAPLKPAAKPAAASSSSEASKIGVVAPETHAQAKGGKNGKKRN